MGIFFFPEGGVGYAMGVVNVRVRGGSSGIVGRHVGGVVVGVSEQFGSSFILLEYLRGIPEVFLRDP